MKMAVKNLQNKDVGNLDLPDSIFGTDIRTDIMHLMVNFQLNKRRAGTQSTKIIGEVSGSGKKPFNQKGGGRARQGSHRSPQMRGGAVVLGPRPRSHATELPKKIRALALRSALSSKAKNGKLIILDEAVAKDHKTKPMAVALKAMGLDSALILCGKEVDVNFARATSNIPKLDVLPSQGANVYDILRRDVLVLTKDAVNDLTERLA
jgi:large subunit ribosomal protein L4